MIDSHCHLDLAAFDADREGVLAASYSAGVRFILTPGTQASAWPKQIQLCQQHAMLGMALGLHPYFLQDFNDQHLDLLNSTLAAHRDQVLAVGEIGLDFAIEQDAALQRRVFVAQLTIANDVGLPVVLHHRRSHNELIRLLKRHPVARGGVVHAFAGSSQEAHQYIGMGFKLGIDGTITYPRAIKTRNTVAALPLDSLLLETDAPDMPMSGRQGKRNSPEYLPQVVEALAALRDQSEAEIIAQTSRNFYALFGVSGVD